MPLMPLPVQSRRHHPKWSGSVSYTHLDVYKRQSVQWQITNLSCGLAPGQFAYTGGGFDGSSANTKTYADCGFAPGSFAYMGGINDGSALHTKMYGVCADPPQFYTYYGGNADGSSMMKQQNCALVLPVADFTASPLEICVNQNVTFTDASSLSLIHI